MAFMALGAVKTSDPADSEAAQYVFTAAILAHTVVLCFFFSVKLVRAKRPFQDVGMFGFDATKLRLEVDTASMDFDVGATTAAGAMALLAKAVHLTIDDMQSMALMLQEEFPGGEVNKDEFIDVWAQLQPNKLRDASSYTDSVFELFDKDGNGVISHMEYMSFLALASRGTVTDKLTAVFKVFDANNDGGLSLLE